MIADLSLVDAMRIIKGRPQLPWSFNGSSYTKNVETTSIWLATGGASSGLPNFLVRIRLVLGIIGSASFDASWRTTSFQVYIADHKVLMRYPDFMKIGRSLVR